jgi:hypothetical protein
MKCGGPCKRCTNVPRRDFLELQMHQTSNSTLIRAELLAAQAKDLERRLVLCM